MLIILRGGNKIKKDSSFSTKTKTLQITSKTPVYFIYLEPKMPEYLQSYDDETTSPENKSDKKTRMSKGKRYRHNQNDGSQA